MSKTSQSSSDTGDLFKRADLYDRSINWPARIAREVPVLIDVFGPPAGGRIIDAGCGTGRQACALAERGYRVVGTDTSEEMLDAARGIAGGTSSDVEFVHTPYATMYECLGGGFDGIYCLGNALAAASTRDAVAEAIEQFSRCLHVGGQLFVQVLNFEMIRSNVPYVRGPRVANVDGREYISVRHFQFLDDQVQVTNVTLWHEAGWHQRSHIGMLYPVSLEELRTFCGQSHLRVDHVWGSYAREPFDVDSSTDMLVVATRV